MRLIPLMVLLLTACDGGYWKNDMPDFEPKTVLVSRVSQDDLSMRCGYATETGCTIRLRETATAVVFLGPKADNCTLRHEFRHASGWSHDAREVYRHDCGEG